MFEVFHDTFLEYVNKTQDCWLWEGKITKDGYGVFYIPRLGGIRAHRLMYSWLVSDVPNGLPVHHKCKNKNCVNPEHLKLLTRSEHKQLHAKIKLNGQS